MHADDKRNILIAAVFTIAILFGWPYVAKHFFPPAAPPATTIEGGKTTPVAQPSADPALDSPAATRDRATVLRAAPRIAIETPKLKGSLSLKGARIDDVVLPTYKETVAKDSQPIRLFSPSGTADAYFAGLGWSGEGVRAPDGNTVWTAEGMKLTPTTPVTLRWDNGAGQLFSIKLTVDQDYMIAATQTVQNKGAGTVGVRPYAYVSRRGKPKDQDTWTIHVGPIGVFNDAANYGVDFKTLDEEGPQKFTSTGGWVGFTDHYWLAAVIPDQTASVSSTFRKGDGDQYQADFSGETKLVAAGKAVSTTSRIFVGAKETQLLDRYQDGANGVQGIAKFDRSIDWGWFYWFEKPIFYLLDWLFKAIGNFGVAIICLTFIVRGIMFPVAQRQFASMAQMRAVQPKMKAIQEKYKNDKAKQQQEIMELYKREKVNPLAGCLPIFLQIPVFFALYKVLTLTIEMRHQPFALWIKDLSAPDPLHILNLFGLLPFTPPAFLGIGVLAVLLGITMFLQFRLNPAPMDATQKQVFAIMPWMMMFVMAPFATGLLIYWITSNILTVAQQQWLYRRHPALKEKPAG
ncbi:membrane protein insertase YidC [Sphingobium sufflavum]|uniref:membrane protein insertase YidC n=1 Tax=Sphingobium sufflavum TaxID=1129547 RepID=UPI001F32A37F|nr:membrane protein insertase YidC [Sphingobium sufflavum]MCE7795178.1 membrane protein insertase YidC [Sphingobium sufflavum]